MNRICKLLSTLALLCAICLAGAQKTAVKGMIWKASSADTTIYLVGSIHVGTKAMYPLAPIYDTAFNKAADLVVEIDLNKEQKDPTALMSKLMGVGMYQGDDDLYKHVPLDTAKQLRSFCAKNSFPPDVLGKFKPWIAFMMVEMLPMMSQGLTADLGIDEHFLKKAEAVHKPVEEAESLQFQIDLLSSMPEAEQVKILQKTLAGGSNAAEVTQKMETDWINGDVDGLSKLLFDPSDQTSIDRKLLQDRNPHMADVAERFLKYHKPCLFVVGAGHLIGPEGVVAILKQRGYAVEQVLN